MLAGLSFAVMATLDNLLAAALALLGGAFYVLVYTVWLKRTTPQNIVIGGAAGAIPVLAGWAAAHGRLGLGGLFLFAALFALFGRSEIQRAGKPMPDQAIDSVKADVQTLSHAVKEGRH